MWPFAVLTGDRSNEGFFFIRKCMTTILPLKRGGRKVGFRCTLPKRSLFVFFSMLVLCYYDIL